jgi:hypothetical protein
MTGTKKAVRGSGRVAFLARLDAIKKMIEAGHPLLTIYQEHQSNLSFSYSQFVKYVHKYIRSKPKDETKTAPTIEAKRISRKPEPGQPAFTRNEDRDDLINPK